MFTNIFPLPVIYFSWGRGAQQVAGDIGQSSIDGFFWTQLSNRICLFISSCGHIWCIKTKSAHEIKKICTNITRKSYKIRNFQTNWRLVRIICKVLNYERTLMKLLGWIFQFTQKGIKFQIFSRSEAQLFILVFYFALTGVVPKARGRVWISVRIYLFKGASS